jgi:arginyl-tRNA synthetase
MSSRRGRYLTLDSIIDEAIKKAYNEVSKRSPTMVHHEKEAVSKMVGMGSLKFAFASLDPKKNVTFDWDRILSFEGNSGPFVQYAHARACSILRKAGALPSSANYELMKHPLEEGLILMVASFPDVFVTAADELRPNLVAEFALELAEKFNSFYDALPVLKAEDELRNARLLLVKAVQAVLRNALSVLGIEAPERM